MRNWYLIFIALFFAACEEAEELTAEDFINQDVQALLDRPFFARIDNFPYNRASLQAQKLGEQFVFRAYGDLGNVSLITASHEVGDYFGDSRGLNQLYLERDGDVYTSLKLDGTNDALITIAKFDLAERKASGFFSGTVFSTDEEDQIVITDGQFVDVDVFIPFFGEMQSDLSNGDFFQARKCNYLNSSNQGMVIETITASANNDTNRITILIMERLQLGNYDVQNSTVNFTYNANVFDPGAASNNYIGQSGSISIDEINPQDRRIKGRFNVNTQNFNGTSLNFQNGTFTAVYQ